MNAGCEVPHEAAKGDLVNEYLRKERRQFAVHSFHAFVVAMDLTQPNKTASLFHVFLLPHHFDALICANPLSLF